MRWCRDCHYILTRLRMLRLSIIFFSCSLLLAADLNQKSEASRWVDGLSSRSNGNIVLCTYITFCQTSDIDKYQIGLQHIYNIVHSSGELSPAPARNGRLFYVYTQKTTTTLITATNCWVSSTSVVACGRRKKRALFDQGDLNFDTVVAPSG